MPTKVVVEPSYPANIISRTHFRKLRERHNRNVKRLVMENIAVENFVFYGFIKVEVEHNSISHINDFYLREGREDFVIVNKETAKLLGFLCD